MAPGTRRAAGEGVDVVRRAAGPGRRTDVLDPVVPRVGDEQGTGGTLVDAARLVEERRRGRSAVSCDARGAGRATGDGVDVAGGHGHAPLGPARRRDLLDPVVQRVGDVEVVVAVPRRHVGRIAEKSRCGRSAVPGMALAPPRATGDRVDVTGALCRTDKACSTRPPPSGSGCCQCRR